MQRNECRESRIVLHVEASAHAQQAIQRLPDDFKSAVAADAQVAAHARHVVERVSDCFQVWIQGNLEIAPYLRQCGEVAKVLREVGQRLVVEDPQTAPDTHEAWHGRNSNDAAVVGDEQVTSDGLESVERICW